MDGGGLPKIDLSGMCSGPLVARDKEGRLGLDSLERLGHVFHAFDASGLLFGWISPDIVVHDGAVLKSKAVDDKFFLPRLGVHE